MRVLILVAALVTSGLCLPAKHKPNKLFPKKYIKGKDSYSIYKASPKDVIGPVNDPSLLGLVAPSSYDAYSAQPQDPILPPKGSSYAYVSGTPIDDLVVPEEDSYSNPDGTLMAELLPPPVDAIVPEDEESSYSAYTEEASERLVAPIISSYDNFDDAQPMGDALAHLAAMAHMLRQLRPSSYDSYEAKPQDSMMPPKGSTYTSVSGIPVDGLVAPAEDSYSNPEGSILGELLPPPVDAVIPEYKDSSYSEYTEVPSERLMAPILSSYTTSDDAQPMGDALFHLAARAHQLRQLRLSSYDAYEAQPQDPILPPKGSTYTSVSGSPVDKLVAPVENSYSSYDSAIVTKLVPPPVETVLSEDQDSSYSAYTEEASERLEAPSVSSYDNTDNAQPMGDVLVHLAAMSRMLPQTQSSSYSDYHVAKGEEESMKGPATMLMPPSVFEHPTGKSISSYDEVPKVMPLTPEQKEAAAARQVAIPSLDMQPPRA